MRMSISAYNGIIKAKGPKRSKYGNKITEYNGTKFDSAKEAKYARELDLLRKAQEASQRVVDWQGQVRYPLAINDAHICTYVLDFLVQYADGRQEHVDVKGVKTSVYQIKKKMMKAVYDIDIIEV